MLNETMKCSFCGSENLNRIRRKKWMKTIPFSELHKCHNCDAKFLLIINTFKIMTNRGYSKFTNVIQQNQ